MAESIYTKFKRLLSSILTQWMFIVVFLVSYYWVNHVLPENIWHFFGLAQNTQLTVSHEESVDFLKTLTSFPDFRTMAEYLGALLSHVSHWGYLNLTLIFAKVTRFVSVGICNIVLLYMALCILGNIFKTYRQKVHQKETVDLVIEALVPQMTELQMEVRHLRSEIKIMRNKLDL